MSKLKPLPEFINGFRVVEDLGRIEKHRFLIAECKVCKKHFKVRKDSLPRQKSCNCLFFTPGVPRRLQRIYNSMKSRCNNPNHIYYYRYGGAGIKICAEWNNNSHTFYNWSLSNGYDAFLSIDRIDNSKGYSPENCRWVTKIKQARNTTKNKVTEEIARLIQAEPKRQSLNDLALKYGISKSTLKAIKYKQNWKGL